MASLSSNNGLRVIQYVGLDGKVKTLRLGRCEKKHAETVRSHIENILQASHLRQSMKPETAFWLASLPEKLHAKLVRHGTVEAKSDSMEIGVSKWFDLYIADRSDLSLSSIANLKQARAAAIGTLPVGATVAGVSVADAKRAVRAIQGKFAPATAATHIKKIKQVFAEAVDARLIKENPFDGIKAGSQVNRDRFRFVTHEEIKKVIDACPDREWRLLFALARFAGLRVPSETLAMKWGDIDFAAGKMRIFSSKTARSGKPSRIVPIFAAVEPYLLDCWRFSQDAGAFVFQRRTANPRTTAERIIKRAGLEQWEKLFQNLRSSCETELVERFPLHVACAFIGNSASIAAKHYLQVTEDHYRRAVKSASMNGVLERSMEQQNSEIAAANADSAISIPPRGVASLADSYRISTISKKALRKALGGQRSRVLAKAYRRVTSRKGAA